MPFIQLFGFQPTVIHRERLNDFFKGLREAIASLTQLQLSPNQITCLLHTDGYMEEGKNVPKEIQVLVHGLFCHEERTPEVIKALATMIGEYVDAHIASITTHPIKYTAVEVLVAQPIPSEYCFRKEKNGP